MSNIKLISHTIQSTLTFAITELHAKAIENPRQDARLLLAHVLNKDQSFLLAYPETPLSKNQHAKFTNLLQQRLQGRPISKIIGYKEFWSLRFITSEHVLDPRPDSETLIESVLDHVPNKNTPYRILDLGTGSGCLLLTLLTEYKNATGIGVDLSPQALNVAQQNAQSLKIHDRVALINARWADALHEKFDIIISNPPYIPSADIAALQDEVKIHDPLLALDGGLDGLDCYREIYQHIPQLLSPKGICAFEIGFDQALSVKEILEKHGLLHLETRHDLSNHPRIIVCSHHSSS